MLFISNYLRVLIFFIALVSSSYSYGQNVIAEIDGAPVTQFEVNSFVNTVLPIGKFHSSSLSKEKYWKDAVSAAVESRLVAVYMKKHRPEIYKKSSEKANEILGVLKKRFNTEDEFNNALKENGITVDDLLNTYIDLNIKQILKDDMDKIEISDEDLKKYYEENQSMFNLGKSFNVRNCLVKADARELNPDEMEEKRKFAEDLKVQLKNGKENAWNLCDNGTYPKEDTVYRFSKNYEVEDIFKLKAGDFGGPYKNIYGYLILEIKKENAPEVIPFEEVKNEIQRIMKDKMFKNRYAEIVEKAKNEITVKTFDNSTLN